MRSHAAPLTVEATSPEKPSSGARFAPRGAASGSAGVHSLPPDVARRFETALGHRFGDVRVHADGEGARTARRAGAAAVTVGRDIFFGAGRYRPRNPEGQRLLGHELAHVAQWRRGGGAPGVGPIPAARRKELEVEARTAGEHAAEGGRAAVSGALPHASPLLHPVYISRHGQQGFLDAANDFFERWGYSPITTGVDSIEEIVADLTTRSGIGRVTIVSHAHPTNINMALWNGGSPQVLREHMEALTVPRTGVIGSGDPVPATVSVPNILATPTSTARTAQSFEALVGREGTQTHLLPEAQLQALMTAIAGDQQAAARLARIGEPDDPVVRQYVWWTLDRLFITHGGFQPDRAAGLRRLTERARESYRGTMQVAAAAAPSSGLGDRDFERLDQEIERLTAGWPWPVPADEPAREAAEQRAESSPYAVVNAILWNPAFLSELAGADQRVTAMVEALPTIEAHYVAEATRDLVIGQLGANVLTPLGGAGDRLVRQWAWWVIEGAYPGLRGFGQNVTGRIRAAAEDRREAYRDLIQAAFRAAGGNVPDQAAFDAAAAEVRQALGAVQFQGAVPGAAQQRNIAAQLQGSPEVTGLTTDPTFLRQLEVVRALVTSSTWFEIQGCRAGQDVSYLEAFRDMFANSRARPKVSAPEWFQIFGHYGSRPVNDAEARAQWGNQHVRTAFAHWFPILTGGAAPQAPTDQDLVDFLLRPMAMPLSSPGNVGHDRLLVHRSMSEDAFLAWLGQHGYRLTRESEIRQALFRPGATFGANVTRSVIDWLAEQRQGGEVRFRPDPDYANHIVSVQ